jgi:cell wall assembly regulator SMI1
MSLPERKIVWIFKRIDGWFQANDPDATDPEKVMVAKNPSLKKLEESLDYMFDYHWRGYIHGNF